ncbi:MAG TPA: dTDP-4-dehydrorhamnose 3,5-epimerase [Bacteroidota bacterium]|nr:dTDP-4-dehydrorhamnose 3,5-epimerase [Bacteroidota bacterium]
MGFSFSRLSIPDVILIAPELKGDSRGFFIETYKLSEFQSHGIPVAFVQDNHSRSTRNVLRGLHYQNAPKAQGKLVRCIRGTIYDVCVDIRKKSPTYGRWVGQELSEENRLMLYMPPGFAHGFVVTSEFAEVSYKCTEEYSPEHDKGILWNDPDIGIDWKCASPVLSAKDMGHPRLKDALIVS